MKDLKIDLQIFEAVLERSKFGLENSEMGLGSSKIFLIWLENLKFVLYNLWDIVFLCH